MNIAGKKISVSFVLFLSLTLSPRAQVGPANPALDPTTDSLLINDDHGSRAPLPEQYIWTWNDAAALQRQSVDWRVHLKENEKVEPHFFRYRFKVQHLPTAATLYIAGPRSAVVYINGKRTGSFVSDLDSPLGFEVYASDVTSALRQGDNVLALEVVRGKGVDGDDLSRIATQEITGEVLATKIVAAPCGYSGKDIVISNPEWKSELQAASGWQALNFDDHAWHTVQTLGSIEGSIDLFQQNADTGMYRWPGYDGISPFLRHYRVAASAVEQASPGTGQFSNLAALLSDSPAPQSGQEFIVNLPSTSTDQSPPTITLDFGREVSGRIAIASDSDMASTITVQEGESVEETVNQPYFGIDSIQVPSRGIAYGPKGAFRYAKLRFPGTLGTLHFRSITLDGVYYPVHYEGSFESSDPILNRIWEIGAYTAHLCMQDDIWDAPKRDRGRWMGDMDVSGRVISSVFADQFLMEDTFKRLIAPIPVRQHVNGIPGYSAFWITGLADYYRHTGSREFLSSLHEQLVQLLQLMDKEFDSRNVYANRSNQWLFVDWSPELNGDTPESRRASDFEYYAAFNDGAWLLNQLGDSTNAEYFTHRAQLIREAAQQYLLDPETSTFGDRWQTNAMAIYSGIAEQTQQGPIWDRVLSTVGHIRYNAFVITPYYNAYVINAMAMMNHRREALDWIRQYWGGMVKEGATSTWEAYDPSWPKRDFHASLQADNTSGYSISLAHGWSAAPTYWMIEQVLGIRPTGPGFTTATIRPDLIDLQWARGSEPTPHGLIRVDLRRKDDVQVTTVDLPSGVDATVLVPIRAPDAQVLVNGQRVRSEPAEDGARSLIHLNQAGHFVIEAE